MSDKKAVIRPIERQRSFQLSVISYQLSEGRREKVKLVSTAGTGYYYTLNKLKGQDKLTLKKYDPKVRKHVDFKEAKLQK